MPGGELMDWARRPQWMSIRVVIFIVSRRLVRSLSAVAFDPHGKSPRRTCLRVVDGLFVFNEQQRLVWFPMPLRSDLQRAKDHLPEPLVVGGDADVDVARWNGVSRIDVLAVDQQSAGVRALELDFHRDRHVALP